MNPPAAALDLVLQTFQSGFTQPTFALLLTLVQGWILCPGRHTLTRRSPLPRQRRVRHPAPRRRVPRST